MGKESNQSIRIENGEITTDNREIQKIIRDYCKQFYANTMDRLEKKWRNS